MAVSSYGSATRTSGVVRIVKDLDLDLTDRHVLIVEDIVDSGLTLAYLRKNLKARNPASLEVCALLVKEGLQKTDPDLKYMGFRIPPDFVIGYGLDVAERYRNLPVHRRVRGRRSERLSGSASAPEAAFVRGRIPPIEGHLSEPGAVVTKRVRILLAVLVALVVIAVLVVPRISGSGPHRESLGLTEFEKRLDDGQVQRSQALRPLERAEGRARRRHEVRRPVPGRIHRRAHDADRRRRVSTSRSRAERTNVWEAMLLSIVPLVVVMGLLIF